MKTDQLFTPKYWICHNKTSDDVYINTADKSYYRCIHRTVDLFGEDWREDEELEIILIEIKMVDIENV